MSVTSPLTPELIQLFANIEREFEKTTLGDDQWYILAISCLSASRDPEAAAALYLYIISKPQYQASGTRQLLVRRLRESLVKSICLIGVCKPIQAVLAIANVERQEDRDLSSTRPAWQADTANHDRAVEWFKSVYTRNASDTIELFDAHRDFAWISTEITYGLYLSDRQVLNDIETQLVVLPAIMSQNLPVQSRWHIRGTRRVGVSKQDMQIIWDSVQKISAFFGVVLDKVPTVDEVEPDI